MRRPALWRRRRLVALGLTGAIVLVGLWPVTTRQGVDFTVHTDRIPLYLKAVNFLDRHLQYRHLAQGLTRGLATDAERARAIFGWTRAHIRPTPDGFPIMDDHILHIMIRGYGQPDQMADVFATLATYAGIPAFWDAATLEEGNNVIVSFAKIDGRWAMFDVANGLMFTDGSGRFHDVQELLARLELVDAVAGKLAPAGRPYRAYVEAVRPFRVPRVLRAHQQMPLPRLAFELKQQLQVIGRVNAHAPMSAGANR